MHIWIYIPHAEQCAQEVRFLDLNIDTDPVGRDPYSFEVGTNCDLLLLYVISSSRPRFWGQRRKHAGDITSKRVLHSFLLARRLQVPHSLSRHGLNRRHQRQ